MSKAVDRTKAEILRLVRTIAPLARVEGIGTRDSFSCIIIVPTDAEQERSNSDTALLDDMKAAAASTGRKPDYLSAISQETVDRRYGGNWTTALR